MKIGGEEVEPLGSYDRLKPGAVLWATWCMVCGGKHRMLVSSSSIRCISHGAVAWPILPVSRCDESMGIARPRICTSFPPVNLYLVIDGLPDQAADEHQRRVDEHGARALAAIRERQRIQADHDRYVREMRRLGRNAGRSRP